MSQCAVIHFDEEEGEDDVVDGEGGARRTPFEFMNSTAVQIMTAGFKGNCISDPFAPILHFF